MFGHIGHNQPRPAKDMGLVQDGDFIGQRLEAYHVCRVASAVAHGKILNRTTPHFSAATAPLGVKHLQDLKMFAATFQFGGVLSCRHDTARP